MLRSGLLALAALGLTGCVSIHPQEIQPQAIASLHDRSIVAVTRDKPDFAAFTPSRAAFGLLGAAVIIHEGNAVVADNHVDDPADVIASTLQASLAAAHQARVVAAPLHVESDDAAEIAAAAGSARYVLDVKTINWSVWYFPTAWAHYRVIYNGRARLIDVEHKTVVAESGCSAPQFDSDHAPTYDELMANQAALLKSTLRQQAADCTRIYSKTMFPHLVTGAGLVAATPGARVATAAAPASTALLADAAPLPVSPLVEPHPSAQYLALLAAAQNSHSPIDPASYWYRPEVADWVAARKSEFMQQGAAPEVALRRAIDSLDHF